MSSQQQTTTPKPPTLAPPQQQAAKPVTPIPAPAKPASQSLPLGAENLFHFAECTNCRHILPLSTTTEKYFAVLAKDPRKPTGLGEKCMRCGADSWVVAR